MAQNENREIDRTYLSLDSAIERGIHHQDYASHYFRWSAILKFLREKNRYEDAIVCDVACGKEFPVIKRLYVNRMTPKYYFGIDANTLELPEMLRGKKVKMTYWGNTDFSALPIDELIHEGRKPNVFIFLECFEHVHPELGRRLLQHMHEAASDDATFFFSTPCYNGAAAGNHVAETTYQAFGSLLEDLGFSVIDHFGTFASQREYRHLLSSFKYGGVTTNLEPMFDRLREYYDSNTISNIFAPLFPANSRNVFWILKKKTGDAAAQMRLFPALTSALTPWCQHKDWFQLSGYTHRHTAECEDRIDGVLVGNTLKCGKEGVFLP
jgi:hypothetical protein